MKHPLTIRVAAVVLMTVGMGTLSFGQTASKHSFASTSWLLTYKGTSSSSGNGSDIRTEARFHHLLVQSFRQRADFLEGHPPLWQIIEDYLGVGTGNITIKDDRYAMIDGCVRHVCPDRQEFLWVDTDPKNHTVFFAALDAIQSEGISKESPSLFHLWIFGNHNLRQDGVNNESLPDQFLYPLQDWIDSFGSRHVVSAIFVGPGGKMTPLLTNSLHLPGFQAAPDATSKEQQ